MAEFQRNVAYKVWMRDLVKGKYVKGSGDFEAGYVDIKNIKVSRVNIIGVVVDRFNNEDGSYVNVTLDDSSSSLKLRCWREDVKVLDDVSIGDCVIVVGKVKDYNEEIYVVPEAVRKMSPKWLEFRKLELLQEFGTVVEESQAITKMEGEPRAILIELIEKYDKGDGAEYDAVLSKSGLPEHEAEGVIKDMIREGEIFEIRNGFLKVML